MELSSRFQAPESPSPTHGTPGKVAPALEHQMPSSEDCEFTRFKNVEFSTQMLNHAGPWCRVWSKFHIM